MNRFEMFNAMVGGVFVRFSGKMLDDNVYRGKRVEVYGRILSIGVEDGSGHSFIVTVLHDDGKQYRLYVKG